MHYLSGALAFATAAHKTHPLITWLWWPAGACLHRFNGATANSLAIPISAQRQPSEMPISESFHERDQFAYLKSRSLRVRLLIQHTCGSQLLFSPDHLHGHNTGQPAVTRVLLKHVVVMSGVPGFAGATPEMHPLIIWSTGLAFTGTIGL